MQPYFLQRACKKFKIQKRWKKEGDGQVSKKNIRVFWQKSN